MNPILQSTLGDAPPARLICRRPSSDRRKSRTVVRRNASSNAMVSARKTKFKRVSKRILSFILIASSAYALVRFVPVVLFPVKMKNNARERQVATGKGKHSLGICVTGQLCRLELRNKAEFFIAPALKTYDMHVHFELQDGECVYTNYQARVDFDRDAALHSRTGNSFISISALTDWLDERVNVDEGEHAGNSSRKALTTSFSTSTKFGVPVVQYRYVYSLNKVGHVNESARAVNHWRQWKSYRECLNRLNSIGEFDLYIRMREDLLFHAVFVPPLIWLDQSKNDVWVPSCASWEGYNDKIALVHPRARESYFAGILDTYESHYDDVDCATNKVCKYRFRTHNPETFLREALSYLKVRVQPVDPEHLPCVTGTYMGGTRICFHQYHRQLGVGLNCLPSKERHSFKPPCHEFLTSAS